MIASLFAAALVQTATPPLAPPVTNIEYEIAFSKATAANRTLVVTMRFEAGGAGSIRLSLPSWTPGAYEISNFAKRVSGFGASTGSANLEWDKADFDTWRIAVPRPGPVAVQFTFAADVLDNAAAWAKADFLFVNGTNVFLYPEDGDLDFPAAVTVTTEPNWSVATGMKATGKNRFAAPSYHDLVDMPLFVGRFDVDSALVDGKSHRVASYPAGAFAGPARRLFWDQLRRSVPVMAKVFGETPWDHYTTLLVFDGDFGGGSALEHQNSHLGIYSPDFIGTPILASITAHEIFHTWNVKRLRPSDMVPYRYDAPQPTTLLWVSEGITDYYADLALVRSGIVDSTTFLNLTLEKIVEVAAGNRDAHQRRHDALGGRLHRVQVSVPVVRVPGGVVIVPRPRLAGHAVPIDRLVIARIAGIEDDATVADNQHRVDVAVLAAAEFRVEPKDGLFIEPLARRRRHFPVLPGPRLIRGRECSPGRKREQTGPCCKDARSHDGTPASVRSFVLAPVSLQLAQESDQQRVTQKDDLPCGLGVAGSAMGCARRMATEGAQFTSASRFSTSFRSSGSSESRS